MLHQTIASPRRAAIEAQIERLIDILDRVDRIHLSEDEPHFRAIGDGLPGDAFEAELTGDELGDQSWLEWHELPGSTKAAGAPARYLIEDAEDDDPAEDCDPAEDDDPSGQCDEDGLNTMPDGWSGVRYGFGPGCVISDAPEQEEPARPIYGINQAAGAIGFKCKGRTVWKIERQLEAVND